jgi:non-specific serine/threonine protein kinase
VEQKGQPDIEMLKARIGDKHLLLILDNCEHLIEDIAPLASGLLSACPRLKIIVTSRESLRVLGEWQYPVPTLELPKSDAPTDSQSAMQIPAVALFAERARAVRPDFTLNTNNIQAVASICNQLDGLPLAIELLASRIRLMSPQALLERMSDQFILSADGMRAVSARQKTLNNAIGWSYDFLSPDEQRLFAYLSVFSGGFILEEAEVIFSGMGFEKTITEIVTSLSDKSLLLRTADSQEEIRFAMLFTIQEFAREHLQQTGNGNQIRDAHLHYFVQYAEAAEKEMRGPRQAKWIERIEAEHNNNRAALEWSVSSQKTESALRLLWALGWSWEVRGHYNEARDWLERICTLPNVAQYPALYAQILNHVGRYFWTQGDVSFARASLEESRLIAYPLGESGIPHLAETLNWLGLLVLFHEEDGKEQARAMFQQGLELYTKCEDAWGMALTSFHLGILESELRQNDPARSLFEQSYKAFQKLGDIFFLGRVSLFLGYLYFDLEDRDQSRFYFEEHLRFDSSLKFWNGYAEALRDLGKWHDKYGEMQTAQDYFEQSRTICREHGLTPLI